MPNFLDSEPYFTGLVSPNVGVICLDQLAFRFWISLIVAEKFAIKIRSCVKSAQILHVLAPKFLGEGPRFLDLHYLIIADTDHMAKFRSDRTRELGDPMAN